MRAKIPSKEKLNIINSYDTKQNCYKIKNYKTTLESPTKEDFTKYSFPSKNIEYMSTGRPLLTTKLPGMPEEYYPYVYMFETESLDGYRKTLKEVLEKDYDELAQKGREAQSWVLKNKNNVVQTRRIIELYKSSSC